MAILGECCICGAMLQQTAMTIVQQSIAGSQWTVSMDIPNSPLPYIKDCLQVR